MPSAAHLDKFKWLWIKEVFRVIELVNIKRPIPDWTVVMSLIVGRKYKQIINNNEENFYIKGDR